MSINVADILRIWYLIEMLSPQVLRLEDPDQESTGAFQVKSGHDLPWPSLHARQQALFDEPTLDTVEKTDDIEHGARDERPATAFLIYLGLCKIARFDQEIIAAAHAARTTLDDERKSKDLCAFGTIAIDERGFYIDDSLVVSTLPWGLQQLRLLDVLKFVQQPNPSQFEAFVDDLRREIPVPRSKPLSADDICGAAEFLRKKCSLEEVIPFDKHAHGLFYQKPTKEPRDLLNSFFYKDIINIMQRNAAGTMPAVLRHIFRAPAVASRVELFHDVENLSELVRPANFPVGAWPDVNLKPALMQQAAVILANRLDAEVPMLAVNGPPGTGKTTMIKSFVADQTVRRALSMCECDTEEWVFFPDENDPQSGYYCPPAAVTGFEIVVASSNNGAVENISDELPDAKSVAGFAEILGHDSYNYYLPVARSVARHRVGNRKREPWGLIAASLGNKKKLTAFIEPFLYEKSSTRPPGHLTILEFHRGRSRVAWNQTRDEFRDAYRRLEALRSTLPSDDTFWSGDLKERHDEIPGLTPEFFALQQELFVKAMRVHRAFIERNWSRVSNNLHAWAKIARRPGSASAEKALALWQTLFLMVPVVSTTFASAVRMFGNIEQLGWVVVDEAGQAVPQAALGMFGKTKRVIVIGDPLQLEPVVPLSSGIIKMFRALLHVDAQWVAANDTPTSLQTIVERASPWGSYRTTKLRERQQTQWIGVPLIVHRRCLEPMFGVANNKVYGGDMLYRTAPCPDPNLYPFGESAWIDERSGRTGRHAVGPQIELALSIVRLIHSHYADERAKFLREATGRISPLEMENLQEAFSVPDIRIVTPFRDIESNFDDAARAIAGESKRWRTWCDGHVGTVHKVQGKEAGLIICVLGLDPSNAGAADFATDKPNFLNVTITRAKHRLYVIGNASLWGSRDYFRDLLCTLRKQDAVFSVDSFLARTPMRPVPTDKRIGLIQNASSEPN